MLFLIMATASLHKIGLVGACMLCACLVFVLLGYLTESDIMKPTLIPQFKVSYMNIEQPCTNVVLRQFYLQNGRFPEQGRWKENVSYFRPSLCYYAPKDVGQCFMEKSTGTILLLGDSQGRHYYAAVISMLSGTGWNCQLREEGQAAKPEKWDYHGNANIRNVSSLSPLDHVLKRGCTSCQSTTTVCSANHVTGGYHGYRIQVSYRANWKLKTSYVAPLLKKHFSHIAKKSMPPDLFLYFVPLQHLKNQGSVEGAGRPQLQNIIKVVLDNIGNNTDVYFLGSPGEVEDKKKIAFWRYKTFEGMLASEKLYMLTRTLYQELKDVLTLKDSHVYGFFNMVNMSAPLASWGTDGVHYQEIWYEHVMRNLLSQHCS